MTDASRPDLPGRDPTLDAAWRDYSVERPPPALDAAILAAAHREAKARPRALSDDDDTLAEAREPSKWWWGLAAAATIGAIAFGLVQLAPPPTGEPTVASDMPASVPSRVADAPTGAPAPASPAAPMPRSPAAAEPDAPAPASPAPPPAPARAPASDAQKAVTPRRESAGPAGPLAKREEAVPQRRDASDRGTPRPFPAAPADAVRVPGTSIQHEAERKQALTFARPAVPAPATEEVPARAASNAPPPARARRADDGRQQALGAAAEATQTTSAREFVARIEAALAASRTDDAVRELNAFRASYPDADERLPAALRPWAATVPPAASKPR